MEDKKKDGGLNPLASLSGYPLLIHHKYKAASSNTQICPGDAVVEDVNGQIETGDCVTPGESLYAGVSLNYGPANTETWHIIAVDPHTIYDCTSTEDDESLATKQRGKYGNLELGISETRQSQHKLDGSSVSANPEKDLLITGASPFPLEKGSRRIQVMINKHANAEGYRGNSQVARSSGRPTLFTSKGAFDRTMKTAFCLATDDNDLADSTTKCNR
jgi:hypothetical protein